MIVTTRGKMLATLGTIALGGLLAGIVVGYKQDVFHPTLELVARSEAERMTEQISLEDEHRLLQRVEDYLDFWTHRRERLPEIAKRLGWSRQDFHDARILIEGSKPLFESVQAGYKSWNDPHANHEFLRGEIEELDVRMVLVFCAGDRVVCPADRTPDHAERKRT